MSSSNLSDPSYKYDFVVATTEASINATMLQFLSQLSNPVVSVCYVRGKNGQSLPIEYDELKKLAKGSDPFKIPNGADLNKNKDCKNLIEAKFVCGFRARLGVPRASSASLLPDIVKLGNNTSAVTFNMLCSEFSVAQVGGDFYNPSFFAKSQNPDNPWVFQSTVDLRLSTVDGAAYGTLPEPVQAMVKNMSGSAFSIQQLLFNLSQTRLSSRPTITGLTPGSPLFSVLTTFNNDYFDALVAKGEPILGCNVVKPTSSNATMSITNLNFQVCPYRDSSGAVPAVATPDQQKLATLNYLCATDGHDLQQGPTFRWNWVDSSQIKDIHGVISINRNTFAKWYRDQLASYASPNCYVPRAVVSYNGWTTNVDYSCSMSGGQAPTLTMDPAGPTVVKYHWSAESSDEAGAGGCLGYMYVSQTYDLTVDFVDTKIIVTQHQVVHMNLRTYQTSGEGNIVDKTMVTTYNLGIDASGQMTVTKDPVQNTDNSWTPDTNSANNFFSKFNDKAQSITSQVKSVIDVHLVDPPCNTLQNYVFPGGKTFLFKALRFSQYQDLVSAITYADPTSPAPVAASTKFLGDHPKNSITSIPLDISGHGNINNLPNGFYNVRPIGSVYSAGGITDL